MSTSPNADPDPFELHQRLLSSPASRTRPAPVGLTTTDALSDTLDAVPAPLQRAHFRMGAPALYPFIGLYRLATDPLLYRPAWAKCKHGFVRGLVVGAVWAALTWKIQRWGVEAFLANSPRIAGLGADTVFGVRIPLGVYTYATLVYAASQVSWIISFFLSKNIRIARDRAWNLTIASRAKGADFFIPYVDESDRPPRGGAAKKPKPSGWKAAVVRSVQHRLVKKVLLLPTGLYPLAGPLVSAWFKALDTSRYLHKQYFAAKAMTPEQVQEFVEDRKWDYRAFGFAAALLEALPILGLALGVSNRVGAAMWAVDLEKRQRWVAQARAAARAGVGMPVGAGGAGGAL